MAQENAPVPSPAPQAITLDYPDNPGGLEKLAKDILKAQKESDTVTAGRLLESLVLPHARSWYGENFGEAVAANEGVAYEAASRRLPVELGAFFLGLHQKNAAKPAAVRFDKSCDENSSEIVFNILQDRRAPVPLYELRFLDGNHFFRLPLFAFVDGGFRFVIPPKFKEPGSQKGTATASTEKPDKEASSVSRIRLGGTVAAAKLIHKVVPKYPPQARDEGLQGTVRFHAIVAKDGTIRQLRLEKGVCSLAQAGYDAVRRWRYAVTTLNGEPVEVDTTIDVIFEFRK